MAYVSRQTYNEYKCERERELYERAIKSRERELQEKIQKATLIVEKRERTKKKEIQEEGTNDFYIIRAINIFETLCISFATLISYIRN